MEVFVVISMVTELSKESSSGEALGTWPFLYFILLFFSKKPSFVLKSTSLREPNMICPLSLKLCKLRSSYDGIDR